MYTEYIHKAKKMAAELHLLRLKQLKNYRSRSIGYWRNRYKSHPSLPLPSTFILEDSKERRRDSVI